MTNFTVATRARSVLVGSGVAALTIGAATAARGTAEASPLRRSAVPAAAASLGVAALVVGRGRPGAAGAALRAAGVGGLLGAAGAAALAAGPARQRSSASTPPPTPYVLAHAVADPARSSSTTAAHAAPAPASAPLLRVGSRGPAVAALQARLKELHYAVDTGGIYTAVTRDAVMAFQKVNGLARDGIAGPITHAALEDPKKPQLGVGKPDRIDVDLSTQVLVVVKRGRVAYIVNATSGDPHHPDGRGMATPKGTFSVQRKIPGTRVAPLGELYYPSYFTGGIAVHGSYSVVAERASHGCVRIPRWIEQRVYRDMPVGSQVVVHR